MHIVSPLLVILEVDMKVNVEGGLVIESELEEEKGSDWSRKVPNL